MRVFRITLARFNPAAAAFSGLGTTLAHGRWNHKRPDVRGVYCADSLALSCLETLVHINSRPRVFPPSVYYATDIPDTAIERPSIASLPAGWNDAVPGAASQDYGTAFLQSKRSVALAVPTVVQADGTIVLVNAAHPDFDLKWIAGPFPYQYDARLD
ncbi:MAG: RES family NAD+ phosphorylase [Sulfuricaulis sp.]|nr:RES family NAD+ phosphorylase [Sulfuricaulis sp.]